MLDQPKPRRHRLCNSLLCLLLIVLALLSFAISPSDEAAFRTFATAVERWQVRPEFRSIATEYCILGSRAVRTRSWGIRTGRIVMSVRSLPWLPKRYAVNPTSQMHYQNFGRGPLIAYLHLCGEQSVPDVIGIVESAAANSSPTEADARRVLDSFKMDFPLAEDLGALRSAESLLHDIGPRPCPIRENIGERFKPNIAALAQTLNIAPDPSAMSADEQQAVLERLDSYVRVHDPELWRTKQVSDLSGGIWAQVFGPPYNTLLVPFLWVVLISRFLLILALIAIVLVLRRRKIVVNPGPEAPAT